MEAIIMTKIENGIKKVAFPTNPMSTYGNELLEFLKSPNEQYVLGALSILRCMADVTDNCLKELLSLNCTEQKESADGDKEFAESITKYKNMLSKMRDEISTPFHYQGYRGGDFSSKKTSQLMKNPLAFVLDETGKEKNSSLGYLFIQQLNNYLTIVKSLEVYFDDSFHDIHIQEILDYVNKTKEINSDASKSIEEISSYQYTNISNTSQNGLYCQLDSLGGIIESVDNAIGKGVNCIQYLSLAIACRTIAEMTGHYYSWKYRTLPNKRRKKMAAELRKQATKNGEEIKNEELEKIIKKKIKPEMGDMLLSDEIATTTYTLKHYRQFLENNKSVIDNWKDKNELSDIIAAFGIIGDICNSLLDEVDNKTESIRDISRFPTEKTAPKEVSRIISAATLLCSVLITAPLPKHIKYLNDHYGGEVKKRMIKYRRISKAILVGVVLIICCYFGINAILNRIYFINYTDYIWRNGIPEGIYEISGEEANANAHYCFEVQNNKVLSVTLVDAMGNIMDETLTGRKGRPARIIINYDDDLPERMTFFNAESKFLLGIDLIHHRETNELQGIRIVDQKGIALQLPHSIIDINLNAWLSTDSSEITAKYSAISAFEILDMDDGLIKELSFGLDDYQKDGNGISRMQFDHNPDGRLKEIRYIYENGDLEKVRYRYEGARLHEKEYFAADNTNTRLVRYEYDDNSGKCLVTNTDGFDHLINNQKGIAMLSYEYYSTGRIKYEIRCDSTGLPSADSNGVAIRYYSWDDDSGKIKELAYLDPYWSPIVKDHYARITYENGDNGRIIRWYDEKGPSYLGRDFVSKTENIIIDNHGATVQTEAYYNIDNKIVLFNGAYMWRKTINQFGDIELIEALDEQGNSMMSTVLDYATVKYQYDDRHHQKKCVYMDSEGNEYAGRRSYSRIEIEYTKSLGLLKSRTYYKNDMVICREIYDYDKENGRITQKEYRNGLEKPVEVGGFSKVTVEYLDDENGTIVKRSYYGADGNPIMITPQDGFTYAVSHIGYDRNGHIYLRESFDTQGNRVYDPEFLCYKLVATTDERGNQIKTSYYDKDGESLLLGKEGYAVSEKTYNANNQITSIVTYNIDGKTPIEIDGYSKRENYYDLNTGKYLGKAFFDNNGNKTVAKSLGYWKVEYDYDKAGHTIIECYYDALGSLVINEKLGFAKCTASYDNNGRVIKCTYFGIDGPIVLPTEGAASIEVIYENDKKTIIFLDENGEEMVNDLQGYAKMTIQYDQEGEVVSWVYFDQNSSPMINSVKGYAELVKSYYDIEDKRIVEERYYDEYKKPTAISNGVIGRRWLYNADESIESYTNILVIAEYRDVETDPIKDDDYQQTYEKWELFDYDKNLICIEYYDNKGNHLNCSGWSRCEMDYDDYSRISEKRYYDINNSLTKPDDDISALIQYSYEENGRICYEYYFDESGNHVKNLPGGEYGRQYKYDQEGKNISIGYLDTEGKLIDYRLDEYAYGYSACLFGFDDQNRNNTRTLCNEKFEPFVSIFEGYCTTRWNFDENGRITTYEYLDADGNPMFNNREGCARKQIIYDEEGNQLGFYRYDLDGKIIE